MTYVQWLLVAIIVAVGFVGGYYQLYITVNLKEGKRTSVFTGGWIFHPEYLEENGRAYRKKLIGCWMIIVLLIACIKILGVMQQA
jgi:hypothetical protein